jgi:IS5 family transposase
MMRLPDESTILRFRHLLDEHNLSIQLLSTINATLAKMVLMLKAGTVVDATLIVAPSSTKDSSGERGFGRDPGFMWRSILLSARSPRRRA